MLKISTESTDGQHNLVNAVTCFKIYYFLGHSLLDEAQTRSKQGRLVQIAPDAPHKRSQNVS